MAKKTDWFPRWKDMAKSLLFLNFQNSLFPSLSLSCTPLACSLLFEFLLASNSPVFFHGVRYETWMENGGTSMF